MILLQNDTAKRLAEYQEKCEFQCNDFSKDKDENGKECIIPLYAFNKKIDNGVFLHIWISEKDINAYISVDRENESFEGIIYTKEFDEKTDVSEIIHEINKKVEIELEEINNENSIIG